MLEPSTWQELVNGLLCERWVSLGSHLQRECSPNALSTQDAKVLREMETLCEHQGQTLPVFRDPTDAQRPCWAYDVSLL